MCVVMISIRLSTRCWRKSRKTEDRSGMKCGESADTKVRDSYPMIGCDSLEWQGKEELMAMIQLTPEQHEAVAANENGPVRAVDLLTKEEYVLIRADVYKRLRTDYDATPWTDEERDLLRHEAVAALGWEGMDAYQDDQP